jgi:hypothetical protein
MSRIRFTLICVLMLIPATGARLFVAPSHAYAAVGSAIPVHSHWDDPNQDYEIKACYTPLVKGSGAGSTISFIPVREQNASNFYQLSLTTSGFTFTKRVDRTFYSVPALHTTTQSFGVNMQIMFDFTEIGNTFTVYTLNADGSRGALLDQWQDNANAGGVAPFLQGVNISYYTQPHWKGQWDFFHGIPLDSVGVGHNGGSEAYPVVQDATSTHSVCGTDVTHDDTTPAAGEVDNTGLNGLPAGQSTINWGLASGANYTYTLTVSGITASGSYLDFRDPQAPDNTYWDEGFYRLKLGTSTSKPTIQRFVSGFTANCTAASSTSDATHLGNADGGDGTYTLALTGNVITLSRSGVTLLTVTEPSGDPLSGIRLRLHPSAGEVWTWTGTPS